MLYSHFESTSSSDFMNLPQDLSPEILQAALQGLETQKSHVEAHIQEIRTMLGSGQQAKGRGRPPKTGEQAIAPSTRSISAEAKERIAAAQRKRWAKFRKTKKAA